MPNDKVELEKVPSPFHDRLDARNRNYYPRQNYDPLYDPYDDPRHNNNDDTESSLNMRELWLMVRRRKWLVLTLIALITTIVTIQMMRTKSYYQANSTLEIGKENAAIGRDGLAIAQSEDFDPFFMVNIKTKMLWFTSKALLEDVVVNLKLNENKKFLDTTDKSWFASSEKKNNIDNLPNTVPAGMETEIMRSPAESAKLAPFVKAIEDSLTVQQVRDTRALTISYVHTEPLLAAQINNELMKVFRQKNFTNKMGSLELTGDWLKTSERKVKSELDQAQAALARYAQDKGIISLKGDNQTIVTAKLAEIQSRLAKADAELLKAESLNEDVKQGNVAKLAAEFDDKSGEKMSNLQKELGAAKKEQEVLNVKYGDDHPSVREVKSKIAEIERQMKSGTKSLEDKLRVDFERAKRERNAIEREYFQSKNEAVNENQSDIKLRNFQLEVERKLKLYNDLQDKSQQAELKQKEQYNNIRIMDPAQIPTAPAGPRRTLTILLAFLLSTAAAIGLAFFLEYLDNTIKTVEDVERYAKLPALGVIPAIAGSTSLKKLPGKSEELLDGNGTALALSGASIATQLMTLDNQSTVAEAYRALRTSVLLSSAGHPPKSILVTSGRPGEGKTTTAVNTAISLAQLGATVLIIDCDLRRPKVHKVFGITHTHGLSTYLSRDMDIDSLIHALPIPNLSLLPCGPTPPNPAELISSEKMREMMTLLGTKFDHIIIDSPPLINVTDPVILSTLVDGVIMVVHAGKSTRDVIRRASQELTSVGAKVFGVVLNNVNLQREGYDEYYYQRYYSSYSSDNDISNASNGNGNGNGKHD